MATHHTHASNMEAAADHLDSVRNEMVDDPSHNDTNEQLHLGETATSMRRASGILRKRAGVAPAVEPPSSTAQWEAPPDLELEAALAEREVLSDDETREGEQL